MNTKKVAVLIGTRPGIIKMSPLVHELKRRNANHIVIHSGQHYSEEMDKRIMQDVGLNKPDYHIRRHDSWITHAQQTAYMLTAIEEILLNERPDVLLVCGDANTNLAGALAARKIHVKVGHVESGLRSFDWRMPEEHNRVIIDHISDYLFAPTNESKRYLLEDGVKGKIFVVGNTIVDATLKYAEKAKKERFSKVKELADNKSYILVTLHREENVDHKEILENIIDAFVEIGTINESPIIFPMHPRTRKMVKEFGLMDKLLEIKSLRLVEPMTYLDFLAFLANARLVMTDSGGLQEESCILKVPCITLRESTERHETVKIGANHVAGTKKKKIVEKFKKVWRGRDKIGNWKNPYGDGNTSRRIIDTCLNGAPEDEFICDA